MNNPLPMALAKQYSIDLMNSLDAHQSLDFDGERGFSTEPLFQVAGGQMFGILVCHDPDGNEIILKAFSGQYQGQWNIPGWVPPVLDTDTFDTVVRKHDDRIHELTERILFADDAEKDFLIEERRELSNDTLRSIHGLYEFHCIDGTAKTIPDIFGDVIPPTGTGDCCAPKLLNHAFRNGLQPVSMAEFFYGEANRSGTKEHKQFYGPCDERCKPLMKAMLGLDIIYCEETLIVVNKESGMLSVPGRVLKDCAEARVKRIFPDTIKQPAVHRLDMDTSGLLVYALTKEVHRELSIQFIKKQVRKTYIALLEGVIREESGRIELPFRLDVDNRPYQIYDPEQGKMGETEWRKLKVEYFQKDRLATRIEFTPLTGRTHQLRVHSAHELGLGHPIIGDRLYGKEEEGQRLLLHAETLSFIHPETGERLNFSCEAEF